MPRPDGRVEGEGWEGLDKGQERCEKAKGRPRAVSA